MTQTEALQIRTATPADRKALNALEQQVFSSDRLSLRSFRHHIHSSQSLFLVCEQQGNLLGYGLVFLHRGTRLARLYSLALSPDARGLGLGRRLLQQLEQQASEAHRLYMRLEVAEHNQAAIALYQSMGYRTFGLYPDYYQDHSPALRMQKAIRKPSHQGLKEVPWYQQQTEFTCGPAALMMAMASLNPALQPSLALELKLWRQATTIFMTSGHGGTHPVGLAIAAHKQGFEVLCFINHNQPLFVHGVRTEHKKAILEQVDKSFKAEAEALELPVLYQETQQQQLAELLTQGYAILMLISTYRLDRRKAPHWVVITAMDEECIYVHDPDPDHPKQIALDCQHVPIARADFDKMSLFGRDRLRTSIAIKLTKETP